MRNDSKFALRLADSHREYVEEVEELKRFTDRGMTHDQQNGSSEY